MSVNDIITAAAAEAAALLGSESDERLERIARIETRMLLHRVGISEENPDSAAGDIAFGGSDAISSETADALILAAARLTAASVVAADPAYAERISVGDLTLEGRDADEIVCALERGAESALRLIEGRAPARLIAVKGGAR